MRNFARTKPEKLLQIAKEEIRFRILTHPAGWDTLKAKVKDRRRDCFLVSHSYWYKYSSRVGSYYIGAGYLIGEDEGQLYAVRVPSTISTIEGALNFIVPREARVAREKGREVHRQGDIFFVEKKLKEDDMTALQGTRHKYCNHGADWYRWIVHPQHRPVVLTQGKHYRAYRSTQVHGRVCD